MIKELFASWAGEPCLQQQQLTANGSNRMYFRLKGASQQCVAAVNADVRENEAFFYFASQLRQAGVRVPEVFAVSPDRTVYLQEDLGNTTLLQYLATKRSSGDDVTDEETSLYQQALTDLVTMQCRGRHFDFSHAYPRADFDRQSLQWDFNYFKYCFLKPMNIRFDEQALETDFGRFIDYLLEGECDSFVYRDFQTRNIMISAKQLAYIDFQGARRGAPQYDAASLLFSSKCRLTPEQRASMLDFYTEQYWLQRHAQLPTPADSRQFKQRYYAYVVARIMQALGAYGFRGLVEKKPLFAKSIPPAITNLRRVLAQSPLEVSLPELGRVWQQLVCNEELEFGDERLSVKVFSFSYRREIPADQSGNGGGFVFDCRALPNPGRFDQYRELTGLDAPVIEFLETKPEVQDFLTHVFALVSRSIEDYIQRGFQSLMINFGCTGGQHRSVYCAEQTARYIKENYDCRVVLRHIEQRAKKRREAIGDA